MFELRRLMAFSFIRYLLMFCPRMHPQLHIIHTSSTTYMWELMYPRFIKQYYRVTSKQLYGIICSLNCFHENTVHIYIFMWILKK